MRNRGVLLLALAIAAVLAAGSMYAFFHAGDDADAGPTAVPVFPTASLTPTASPTASPTATATPTETATPEPTATSAPRPTATRTSTSRPTSSTHYYAYPKPTHRYDGLQLTITSNPATGHVGETFTLTGTSTDGDGTIFFNGGSWGDGARGSIPAESNPQHCKSYPPLTSPPGPYQPQGDTKNWRFEHQYLTPGTYTITFRVASVNVDCRPNGPKREDRVLSVRVTVKSPEPTSSPSPAA